MQMIRPGLMRNKNAMQPAQPEPALTAQTLCERYQRLVQSLRPWQEIWQTVSAHPWFQNQLRLSATRAVRKSRRRNEAIEDVIQEVHLSMARTLCRRGNLAFDPGLGRFEAFLSMVIRRNCINAVARMGKVHQSISDDCEPGAPMKHWRSNQQTLLLHDSIGYLDEPYSTVIEMYCCGHSVSEIAERMKCSDRTIYRRLDQATEQLRLQLVD